MGDDCSVVAAHGGGSDSGDSGGHGGGGDCGDGDSQKLEALVLQVVGDPIRGIDNQGAEHSRTG